MANVVVSIGFFAGVVLMIALGISGLVLTFIER